MGVLLTAAAGVGLVATTNRSGRPPDEQVAAVDPSGSTASSSGADRSSSTTGATGPTSSSTAPPSTDGPSSSGPQTSAAPPATTAATAPTDPSGTCFDPFPTAVPAGEVGLEVTLGLQVTADGLVGTVRVVNRSDRPMVVTYSVDGADVVGLDASGAQVRTSGERPRSTLGGELAPGASVDLPTHVFPLECGPGGPVHRYVAGVDYRWRDSGGGGTVLSPEVPAP